MQRSDQAPDEQVSERFVFPGVRYFGRTAHISGGPMITHIATIDVSNPAIELRMLPGERL